MRVLTQLRSLLPGIFLMLFLVVVVSVHTWDVAVTRPWAGMNSDHFVIGSMYHKNDDPNLFQRDFVLSDQNAFSFYTPSFLFLIETIAKTFTGGQFIQAVALMQGPVLLAFLLAATLLYWHVSDSLLVGFIIALISASGMESLKTFWDVIGLHAMLPRTVAMPVLMLATYTFFRTYEPDNQGKSWLWIVTGLLIGIVANLHPPTGMVFATTVGIACVPVWFKYGHRQLVNIGLLASGVTLTALPILLNVLDAGTDGGVPIANFQTFAEVFQLRVAMFPFRYVSGPVTFLPLDQQLWIGVSWLPLTLLSWYAMRLNQRSWTALPFVLVQIVFMWLLQVPMGVCLGVAAFYIWRWYIRDEARELRWMEFAAAIIFTSYFLSVVLSVVWVTFELPALSSIVSQFPRGSRLLVLPLTMIGARFIVHLANRWAKLPRSCVWIEFLALLGVILFEAIATYHVVLFLLFLLRDRATIWHREQPLVFASWVALSAQITYTILVGEVPLVPQMIAIVLGVWAWIVVKWKLAGRTTVIVGVLLIIAVISSLMLSPFSARSGNDNPGKTAVEQTLGAASRAIEIGANVYLVYAGIAGLVLYLLHDRAPSLSLPRWGVYFFALVALLVTVQALEVTSVTRLIAEEAEPSVPYQIGQWARENTDTTSLFLYRDLDGASDSSEFRMWSMRSLFSSFKDLGVFIAFFRAGELEAEVARWMHLMQLDGMELLHEAERGGIDYLIHPLDNPLPLPLVYSYQDMGVFRYLVPPADVLSETIVGEHHSLQDVFLSRDRVQACETFTVETWWNFDRSRKYFYLPVVSMENDMGMLVRSTNLESIRLPSYREAYTPILDTRALSVPCDAVPGDYVLRLALYQSERPTPSTADLLDGEQPQSTLFLATITVID
jgi:hypothetical protein